MDRRMFSWLLGMIVVTVVLWGAGARNASAQGCEFDCPPPCPDGFVCNPISCDTSFPCTTETAHFSPAEDTWTYLFDGNNAIKIGTVVPETCPAGFDLRVDEIQITQSEYVARRFFGDTVCNPSFGEGGENNACVFFRVHGNTAPSDCYERVDYKIFWNFPFIQGNKHDWLLLRAECEDSHGDSSICGTQLFNQDITTSVDRKPPVGTDPVVAGDAVGFSDYIVAISTRHPHKDIPDHPF